MEEAQIRSSLSQQYPPRTVTTCLRTQTIRRSGRFQQLAMLPWAAFMPSAMPVLGLVLSQLPLTPKRAMWSHQRQHPRRTMALGVLHPVARMSLDLDAVDMADLEVAEVHSDLCQTRLIAGLEGVESFALVSGHPVLKSLPPSKARKT